MWCFNSLPGLVRPYMRRRIVRLSGASTRSIWRALHRRPPPGPNDRLPMVARDRHRLREHASFLHPRGSHVPVPHLRQILIPRLLSHAGALLRHTRFGNTLYGAMNLPLVTLTMARYAGLTDRSAVSTIDIAPPINAVGPQPSAQSGEFVKLSGVGVDTRLCTPQSVSKERSPPGEDCMKKLCVRLAVLPLLVSAAACVGSSKSSNPLSPSIAGPIPGVGISAPAVVAPSIDALVDTNTQPITLQVANAETNGVRPLSYRFEVATDP